ncbi:Ribosomal protein L1p/L10e family [Striga hermonthica]|uniref:Ribosomal protein L1p/L10e family n=1 Tax=Striga hermonthica TaxID=68872 RepID=A0A9N7N8X9_STRHE|nr:Ribosomal protein L1p/L10e family [Striga hermonthica]
MAASGRDRIKEDTVRKAVTALLKWKKKKKFISKSDLEKRHHEEEEHHEDESDDFVYLSVTLKKAPPKTHTLAPHRIPLRHSLLPVDYSALNLCLIVDGKTITSESAQKILAARGIPFIRRVFKLSKLKSDYKSFESKQKLYNSFDVFMADKRIVSLLPKVMGKVFYKKKRKIPVPLELNADGSNWKEEMEKAYNSSLLCLSSGTCSAVRVGKWGVNEGDEIVENVFEAVDGVIKVVPRKWSGIMCFHLKFSDSIALPIYERKIVSQ